MFDEIKAPITDEINAFEKKLQLLINSQENFLQADLSDFMFFKPKRLRPLFVFLFSKVLNIKSEAVIDIAIALELLHSASLLHDDIIDNEKLRRNKPTFYNKYGSKLAVLEGDLLLSLALEILAGLNSDILKIFSKRIKNTILGEISQNENKEKIITEKQYLNKTFQKTGNLFLAGLEALFVLKETKDEIKNNLFEFMKNYSIAFQIKNDIDNLKTDKSDIKNGNYTLSVLYSFMEIGSITDNISEKYISMAFDKVDEYQKKALCAIEKIENSIYKTSLLNLCQVTLRS